MKLGTNQRRALVAVAADRVQHVHPFSWAIPGEFYDAMPYSRWFHVFNGLIRRGLIEVDASSKEAQRTVRLTATGRVWLQAIQ